jgi:hypothetical protein
VIDARRVAVPQPATSNHCARAGDRTGAFDALLDDAIAGSIEIVTRRRAVLVAGGDRDADAAHSALAALLPAGTIDPQGAALDLAKPVAISLRAA